MDATQPNSPKTEKSRPSPTQPMGQPNCIPVGSSVSGGSHVGDQDTDTQTDSATYIHTPEQLLDDYH